MGGSRHGEPYQQVLGGMARPTEHRGVPLQPADSSTPRATGSPGQTPVSLSRRGGPSAFQERLTRDELENGIEAGRKKPKRGGTVPGGALLKGVDGDG